MCKLVATRVLQHLFCALVAAGAFHNGARAQLTDLNNEAGDACVKLADWAEAAAKMRHQGVPYDGAVAAAASFSTSKRELINDDPVPRANVCSV
jgi:hypothetical protein